MDTVKVIVVGCLALFASVPHARAFEQSRLRISSELRCQNDSVNRERPIGANRELSQASAVVGRMENQPRQQSASEPEPLRAFESAGRMEGQNVGLFVGLLIFGVVGAIIIFFILYAIFFEPSESSRPYRPTEVKRSENFVPYQHSRSRIERDE